MLRALRPNFSYPISNSIPPTSERFNIMLGCLRIHQLLIPLLQPERKGEKCGGEPMKERGRDPSPGCTKLPLLAVH